MEDDSLVARALMVRLEASEYEVSVANDVTLGMNMLVRNQPDLVILDLQLPSGNAFTLVEQARRLGATLPPIVIITATKSPDLLEQARHLNAAAILEKPFEADVVTEAIHSALSAAAASPGSDAPPLHQLPDNSCSSCL